jgi:protein-serine/threonine kinase
MSTLYKRTEVVGRGKFGVVYKGYHKQTKQVVAIKVLNLDTPEEEVADVQQEIQFLTELKNVPNVTHYYGLLLNDTKLWIIMDYCAGGLIRTLLKSGVFEERYVAVIVRELLVALQLVHRLGVIHRDLKAANVLITKEGQVQLCDFGVAAKITLQALKRTTMAGTPYWMAPEVIREGDAYNAKADIWLLGITVYEITTGNPPYLDKDAMWAMQMILKLTPPRLEGREYLAALKETVALCLDENPDERPLAEDLLKCRLVKLYRSVPTGVLKELVTRYLLWRDDAGAGAAVGALGPAVGAAPGAPGGAPAASASSDDLDAGRDDEGIHIKWDFDLLSSRDYIIENDIDLDRVECGVLPDAEPDTLGTLHAPEGTLHAPAGTLGTLVQHSAPLQPLQPLQPGLLGGVRAAEVPRLLMLLFDEDAVTEPEAAAAAPPPPATESRLDSPTIEIPDMDNLASFAVSKLQSALGANAGTLGRLALSKPPVLHHTQLASGNLEMRAAAGGGGGGGGGGGAARPRKKTISNTLGSTHSTFSAHDAPPLGALAPPLAPPPAVAQAPPFKTPSPTPAPTTSGLMAQLGSAPSPSKSMKALTASSNPLLQPINFNAEKPAAAAAAGAAGGDKPKRPRPPLHIQMPTPSSTLSSLAALTNDEFDVNQFGVSRLQAGATAMTPLTESEPGLEDARERSDTSGSAGSRDARQEIKKPGAYPPRAASISSSPSTVAAAPPPRFPAIPQVNGDFFVDSVPTSRLVGELEHMLRQFTLGLEALESTL